MEDRIDVFLKCAFEDWLKFKMVNTAHKRATHYIMDMEGEGLWVFKEGSEGE